MSGFFPDRQEEYARSPKQITAGIRQNRSRDSAQVLGNGKRRGIDGRSGDKDSGEIRAPNE